MYISAHRCFLLYNIHCVWFEISTGMMFIFFIRHRDVEFLSSFNSFKMINFLNLTCIEFNELVILVKGYNLNLFVIAINITYLF